jgi:hypothetical protein
MTMPKEMKRFLGWARERGWTAVLMRGTGHYRLTKPGCRQITVSINSKNWRTLHNARAAVRREAPYVGPRYPVATNEECQGVHDLHP